MRNASGGDHSACASVYDAFTATRRRFGTASFLAATSRLPEVGGDISYNEAADRISDRVRVLRAAGYGAGDRIALLLGNRPQHFIEMLACNAVGISVVPINPDLTGPEMAYILTHSDARLLVYADEYRARAEAASLLAGGLSTVSLRSGSLPVSSRSGTAAPITRDTEASLLYTSGTTGKPKGCILSNEYYFCLGQFYAGRDGLVRLQPAGERILNPLPVFHQNAGIFSMMGAILTGNCLIMTDRFHASTWWQEVVQSGATIVHYLGVMPAILVKLPVNEMERQHRVRFGIGAGVEPSHHDAFEKRFGFPLIELWGMTEAGGGFLADSEPRLVGSRGVGRPRGIIGQDLEFRLVDDNDEDVTPGSPGELVVRRLGDNPQKGLFDGYLKDPDETAKAWSGGWYHTGDVLFQDETGMLHFSERKKNIIRRSGENIAAIEVETVLLDHPAVRRVAVIAVADEMRGEEVMACIEAEPDTPQDPALAESLLEWCGERLAYYKTPGWMLFLDAIPTTSTQKVQKAQIFPKGFDPTRHPGVHDLRGRKQRVAKPATSEQK